jgi:thymidylate synthase (FAD)
MHDDHNQPDNWEDAPQPYLGKSKEVQKWADAAMYEAQPIDAADGPKAQLLSCNNDPLGSIAAAAKAYKGEFVESLAEITDEERRYYLGEMQKTALAMPLESVHFQFHISGVTRGFTHQMVRQRTAAYSQESTRFAVKTGVPVGLPTWLEGTVPWRDWLRKCGLELWPQYDPKTHPWMSGQSKQLDAYAEDNATPQQIARREWDWTVGVIEKQYNAFVNIGMPAEDARGILPTNLLTQINYHTNLRNFIDEGGKRLCTQAQFEWRIVFSKMLEAIRAYGRKQTYAPNPPMQDNAFNRKSSAWQFDAIAELFRPVCYLTGSCQFNADFDRKCSIRERVQQNARLGIPSARWIEGSLQQGGGSTIPPIEPAEWLLDSEAAR